MKLRNKNGFTLIEVLVVMAVIAIIGSIAVPKYTYFVERQKMSVDIIALKELQEMAQNYHDLSGNYPSESTDTRTSTEEMKSFVDAFYGSLGIEVKADYYILSSTIEGSFGADASSATGFQADVGGVYISAGTSKDDNYYFFIDQEGNACIASSAEYAYKSSESSASPVKVE